MAIEEPKEYLERTKNFTDIDRSEETLLKVLESTNPYTETLKIKSDGKIDDIRMDGAHTLIFGDTPEEVYQLAAEIQKRHPECHFNFETDPEGKWLKYIISKDK